jgi:hypothetical protein
MPDAPAAAETAQTADPHRPSEAADRPPTRSARLLSLVGQLLAFGRDLVATLQRQNTPEAPRDIGWRFGTFNVALIIARITRGIRIAEVLHARLLRGARRLDSSERRIPAPRLPPTGPRSGKPAVPRPPRWPGEDDEALRNLPSAREIAKLLRNRSIGDVIVDICTDLCVGGSEPHLWRQVLDAVRDEGGNLPRLLNKPMTRRFAALTRAMERGIEPATPDWPFPAAFCPPPAAATHPP